jgi:pyruvate dehydrogenase (quinone)
MLLGDFVTAVKYELPITVVVFNNHKLGLIQMEQEVQGYPEFQTELHNPDFAAVARASGGEGIRVTDPADLDGALRTAFSTSRPYIVDVLVNPEERTMPPRIEMWQALGYGVAKVKEFVSRE